MLEVENPHTEARWGRDRLRGVIEMPSEARVLVFEGREARAQIKRRTQFSAK